MKRIKRMRSHTKHAQFLAEVTKDLGFLPRQDIPSPYKFSPTHDVIEHDGQPVIIVETSHRCFDVFLVPPYTKWYASDEQAALALKP